MSRFRQATGIALAFAPEAIILGTLGVMIWLATRLAR